jgi:hypothetical protein
VRGLRDGEASVYGVVLYTDSHANIKKVLADPDYWAAFDEESGRRWAVFAIVAARGTLELPDLPPGTLGMMFPVWREPDANKELLDDFALNSSEELPTLCAFAVDNFGATRAVALRLDDSSVERAYNSLKVALGVVSTSLGGLDGERLHTEGAFNAVHYAVKGYNERKAISRAIPVIERLRGFLS